MLPWRYLSLFLKISLKFNWLLCHFHEFTKFLKRNSSQWTAFKPLQKPIIKTMGRSVMFMIVDLKNLKAAGCLKCVHYSTIGFGSIIVTALNHRLIKSVRVWLIYRTWKFPVYFFFFTVKPFHFQKVVNQLKINDLKTDNNPISVCKTEKQIRLCDS